MSDDLTPLQRAAAFHGFATNSSRRLSERLACALQALDIYEVEVARLTPFVKTPWKMPTWMRRYATAIQHDGGIDGIPYIEDRVTNYYAHSYPADSPGAAECDAIWRQVQVLNALREMGVLREPLGDSGVFVTPS